MLGRPWDLDGGTWPTDGMARLTTMSLRHILSHFHLMVQSTATDALCSSQMLQSSGNTSTVTLPRREKRKTHRIHKKTNRQQQHNNSELILFSIPSIPSGDGKRHTSRELIYPKRTRAECKQYQLRQSNCKTYRSIVDVL